MSNIVNRSSNKWKKLLDVGKDENVELTVQNQEDRKRTMKGSKRH